ncbi:unnamed protein product [Phaedon cochleariae]|uniref:Uncharacterized protein n=1 Tax=Phaedon cochleariae TaxID=80249 RepID=A0A9N9X4T1_PHACE|nr:unnamed protein product [Phaedon cochleariae]
MKLISFLFYVFYVISSLDASIEDQVKKAIQDIKDKIPEPISISNSTITIPENNIISGTLNLSNFVVTGLKAMELSVKYSFLTLPEGFSFELENLQMHTGYQMNIPLFNISLLTFFGTGNLSLSLNGLNVNGSIRLLALPKLFSDVTTSIKDAKFSVTGFLEDPILSGQISDALTDAIVPTLNEKEFANFVENVLNTLVGEIIHRNGTEQVNFTSGELSMSPATKLNDIEIRINNLIHLLSGKNSPSGITEYS